MTSRNIRYLPLLETFDAIMTRGSLVSAADAMGVTQSAVSKQLKQLRLWLSDELFVRTQDGMQPTPRALALRERVEVILSGAADLASEGIVDPADFDGKFVLSATDDVLLRVLPDLVQRLAEEAPRMRLVVLPMNRDYWLRELQSGQVNLLIAVNWRAPELLMQRLLGRDHFVCVMHEKHPLARKKLTLKRYASATHVLVAPLGNERGIVDLELDRQGLKRIVCASVPTFGLLDQGLLGIDRIATVPSLVAERLTASGPFVAKDAPLTLPMSNYLALWHPRFTAEPRTRWILEHIGQSFTGPGERSVR